MQTGPKDSAPPRVDIAYCQSLSHFLLLLDAVHDKDLELARLILIAGCFMLPWLWFLNIFYFMRKLKRGCGKGDPADIRDANWRRLRFCSWLEPTILSISFSSNHSTTVQLISSCVNTADVVCEIIGIASIFVLWLVWIITLSSTWRKFNFWGINLWVEDSPAW